MLQRVFTWDWVPAYGTFVRFESDTPRRTSTVTIITLGGLPASFIDSYSLETRCCLWAVYVQLVANLFLFLRL